MGCPQRNGLATEAKTPNPRRQYGGLASRSRPARQGRHMEGGRAHLAQRDEAAGAGQVLEGDAGADVCHGEPQEPAGGVSEADDK